jgi:hypothetical protein
MKTTKWWESVSVVRDGLDVTWAQAIRIDRLCGQHHRQHLPYQYKLSHLKHGMIDVHVSTYHYVVARDGLLA